MTTDIPPLVARAIGALVRWGLAFGAGYLVDHGIWTQDDAAEIVGALTVALLTLGWGVWQKYRDRLSFLAARQLPPTATGTEIRAFAADPIVKAQAWQ